MGQFQFSNLSEHLFFVFWLFKVRVNLFIIKKKDLLSWFASLMKMQFHGLLVLQHSLDLQLMSGDKIGPGAEQSTKKQWGRLVQAASNSAILSPTSIILSIIWKKWGTAGPPAPQLSWPCVTVQMSLNLDLVGPNWIILSLVLSKIWGGGHTHGSQKPPYFKSPFYSPITKNSKTSFLLLSGTKNHFWLERHWNSKFLVCLPYNEMF